MSGETRWNAMLLAIAAVVSACGGRAVDFLAPGEDGEAGGGGGVGAEEGNALPEATPIDGIDVGVAGAAGDDLGEAAEVPVGEDFSRLVAFDSDSSAGFDRDIYVVPVGGGERRVLLKSDANETQPAFSPDGTKLAFVSDRDDLQAQVFVADLLTREVRKLTSRPAGAYFPAFSADSNWIGYRSERAIYVVDLSAQREHLLIDEPTGCLPQDPCELGGPTFSRDGTRIVYDQMPYVTGRLWQGSVPGAIVFKSGGMHPSLSNDGQRLAVDGCANAIMVDPASEPTGCAAGATIDDDLFPRHPSFGSGNALVWDAIHETRRNLFLTEDGITTRIPSENHDEHPTWVPAKALSALGLTKQEEP